MRLPFIIVTLFLFAARPFTAQDRIRYFTSVQYAGSIGHFSGGGGLRLLRPHVDISLHYGQLRAGHPHQVRTVTIKGLYDPFRIHLSRDIIFHPLQTGVFIAQHFGKNLATFWDSRYEKGYYWWPRNTRQHVFLGMALALDSGKGSYGAEWYFEVNTNDLYLYSYFPNTRTKFLDDIFRFGTGIRLLLH